jgi:hypothetical protein
VLVLAAMEAVAADVEHELARPNRVRIAPGTAGALALAVGRRGAGELGQILHQRGGGRPGLALDPEFAPQDEGELMGADQLDEPHRDGVLPEPVR